MSKATLLEPYDEESARKVAHIIGPSSTAAKALKELKRRREEGEKVSLYLSSDQAIVVGPSTPVSDEEIGCDYCREREIDHCPRCDADWT